MSLSNESAGGRALLPVAAVYAAASALLHLNRRFSKRPLYLPCVAALFDIPVVGLSSFLWVRAEPASADWVCGTTTFLCVLLMTLSFLYLNSRSLLAAGLSSAVVTTSVLLLTGQPWIRLGLALLVLGVAGGVGLLLLRTLMRLVRRSWDLAEARVNEVGHLNEELRRQIAERSRELTALLARSEGFVAPQQLALGDVFDGRYRVERLLGRGGMGAVFEVERMRDSKHLAPL